MSKGFFNSIKDKLNRKDQLQDHKSELRSQFSNTREQDKEHSSNHKDRVQLGQGAVGNGKQDPTSIYPGIEYEDQLQNDSQGVQIGRGKKSSQTDHQDPEVKIKLNALRKLRGRRDDEMHVER